MDAPKQRKKSRHVSKLYIITKPLSSNGGIDFWMPCTLNKLIFVLNLRLYTAFAADRSNSFENVRFSRFWRFNELRSIISIDGFGSWADDDSDRGRFSGGLSAFSIWRWSMPEIFRYSDSQFQTDLMLKKAQKPKTYKFLNDYLKKTMPLITLEICFY